MRTITKGPEPTELRDWRIANRGDINFGYSLMRQDGRVRCVVEDSLVAEQGGLDAYTGQRIHLSPCDGEHRREEQNCHIEHLTPQWRSKLERDSPGVDVDARDLDVTYTNMVACYPEPNKKEQVPYGAKLKDDWPPLSEQHLFVSPLSPGCEGRFRFNLRGEISASSGVDDAAKITIERLGLDLSVLNRLRREAIDQVLGKDQSLSATEARTKLRDLDAETGQLTPFCFVIRQALEKHIARIGHIRAQRRRRA